MPVKRKSNGIVTEFTIPSDLPVFLGKYFSLNGINNVRFIKGSGGEIYIAFCLDASETGVRRVLKLNGSSIQYFQQNNGQVETIYWTK